MAADPVPSPVTGGATTQVESLEPKVIVERYADAKVDVSRYFAGLSEVQIRRCDDTGYRFYFPPSLAGEADFYEQLYNPAADEWTDPEYRQWGEDYQFAFDRIVPGERLLDVGCGYGYFLRRAVEKADAEGIDGNPHAVGRCVEAGLRVRAGSIQDFAEELRESFNTVSAFQVLEHIYDVKGFMTAACTILRPGGRLIFAVPNNEPYLRRFDVYHTWNLPPHHIGLWDLQSLRQAGKGFGLCLEEHEYSEVSGRWVVEAYLHARYLTGVKSEIHQHSLLEKARMAAAAPITVPPSLLRHLRFGGAGTRNVISVVFRKQP